ncbi:MAG: arylsulfatase, partial [Candidatus Aminicenantes bacterium]|nr:arylsulfatase [Candidatus Aminicenantes bacterium]
VFTDAHSGSAVCTPTRYGILTGRYAWRTRLQDGVFWGWSNPLIPTERVTVASFLQARGYTTACVGKWHLGLGWSDVEGRMTEDGETVDYTRPIVGGPCDLGFDYFFGIPASLDMIPYVFIENDRVVSPPTDTIAGTEGREFYRAGPIAPGFRHEDVLSVCTDRAVRFIDEHVRTNPGGPFFLYLPLTAPHTPILPTEEFQEKSAAGPYGDFVHQCDAAVGEVMAVLERHGMTENTLFIVTSDNGCSPMVDFDDLAARGHFPSYIYRGYKADIYEGGHRVPFIARWPKKIAPGRTCDDPICLTDLMATAADILKERLPDDTAEDSVSLLPNLTGTARAPVREAVVHHSINGSFSIRKGRWKLELCPGSGGWSDPRPEKAQELGLPDMQLFDLSSDIGEKINVCERHPEVADELLRLLRVYVDRGRSTSGRPQANDVPVRIIKE